MGQGLRLQLLCDEPAAWSRRIEGDPRGRDLSSDEVSPADGSAGERTRRPSTLLLFDRRASGVLQAVATASRDGRDRVLAVAADGPALTEVGTWNLMRHGASDAFAWDEVGDPLAHVTSRLERWNRIDGLIETPTVRRELIGSSPAWLACLRQLVEIAVFSGGPLLLLGESGTGKELLARLTHALCPRRDKKDLVVLDCTTVVPELSGSEFFGHERGAFTGAVAARDGAFALADGGTLFLDEVGELPLSLQAQLLRVVQERTFKRVGSNVWHRTNFRLICATHRDLAQEVAAGRFRADFYHRIASRVCHLPPLRARREDILPLAERFLRTQQTSKVAPDDGVPSFDRAVARLLVDRDYPGNVRELRQLIERIADRHAGPGVITSGDIPADEWAAVPAGPAPTRATDVPSATERDSTGARAVDEVSSPAPGPAPANTDELARPGPRPGGTSFDDAAIQAIREGCGLREIGRVATEAAIRAALATEEGNLQRAAKRLGVTDRALQMRRAQRTD